MRQCPGDGNALSLANRQALRFAVRDTGNAELFQKCISRSYRLAQQAKRQAGIFAGGQKPQKSTGLQDISDTLRTECRQFRKVTGLPQCPGINHAEAEGLNGLGRKGKSQNIKKSALAGSAWPDDGNAVSGFRLKAVNMQPKGVGATATAADKAGDVDQMWCRVRGADAMFVHQVRAMQTKVRDRRHRRGLHLHPV